MSLTTEIRVLLSHANFDGIEEAWLVHMEERPTDLRFFSPVAKAVADAGDPERSRALLEMLDEELISRGLWRERLELLERSGDRIYDAEELHEIILTCLENLFGEKTSFEAMVEKVGLHRAPGDIPKTWKKANRLATLLTYDVGSIVFMEGKGAGKVIELNMALESFKIDFEEYPGLLVGFRAASKMLSLLPDDHILRYKHEKPEMLENLRDSRPAELLRLVLESYDSPRTGAEIRRDLSGVVPEGKWNSWWGQARKHPQVVATSKGRRTYRWTASSEDAHHELWAAFEKADTRTQLDLLRREGSRDPDLRRRMSEVLSQKGARAIDDDPGLACEIWFVLERRGKVPPQASWSPESLCTTLEDLRPLLAGIKDRGRRDKAYDLIRRKRKDWPEIYLAALGQEAESRSLDLLTGHLIEADSTHFFSFFDQIASQPRKNPAAFTWLAERAGEKPSWRERSPLRLLTQILWALTHEDFAPYRTRLVNLCESGGTLPRLFDHLDDEQAAQAMETVKKSIALEDYQRDPLITSLELKFESLRQGRGAALYATADMIDRKRAELKELMEVEIPANRKAIEEARELGDLRENFEYKSARQRHEYLSARAASLSNDLNRVQLIDPSQVAGSEVVIGSRVQLEGDGEARQITILGPWNSEPEKGILSNESDLAQKLLECKLGDQIEIEATTYRIADIAPYE